MDSQQYLDMLREDSKEETIESGPRYEHKKGSENPYSNDQLSAFIKHVGFNVENIPKFSEMAKKLNAPIVHENVKKDLTNLDNHDIIKDISPLRKNDELDIKKQALKRLIAKYKGQ